MLRNKKYGCLKRYFLMMLSLFFLLGCSSDDDCPELSKTSLVFPEENSECTTGDKISDTESNVTFKWIKVDGAAKYRLNVKNLQSEEVEVFTTTAISFAVVLEGATPYLWFVESLSNDVNVTAIKSDEWRFYNAVEGQSSYAPFPAEIVFPKSGATVISDGSGTVGLEWKGADVDDDLVSYSVYLDTSNPPITPVATAITVANAKTGVLAGTTYYWKVISIDSKNNQSDSGVYQFAIE